jgi:hypothetical protein
MLDYTVELTLSGGLGVKTARYRADALPTEGDAIDVQILEPSDGPKRAPVHAMVQRVDAIGNPPIVAVEADAEGSPPSRCPQCGAAQPY